MEERIYTINLRKRLLKIPRWKKSKKAVDIVKDFLKKHMKSDDIRIGKNMTEKIWEGGNQKPPNKIKIKAIKNDDNIIKAELWSSVLSEELREEKTKEEKKKT